LIDLKAVVGVMPFGRTSGGGLQSIGLTCALCHSTVDDAIAPGIGRRLDGWPNRDLNVGAIAALSPDLSAVANLLQVDQTTVRNVLNTTMAAIRRSSPWCSTTTRRSICG
jgi:hypothetical protein